MRVRFSRILPLLSCAALACGSRSNLDDSAIMSSVSSAGYGSSSSLARASKGSGAISTAGGKNGQGGMGTHASGVRSSGGTAAIGGGTSTGSRGTHPVGGTSFGWGGTNSRGGAASDRGGVGGWAGSAAGNAGTGQKGDIGGSSAVAGASTAGASSIACAEGQISCGSGTTAKCVDTLTDPQNCGQCGSVCASAVCTSGACKPPRCAPNFKLGGVPAFETDGVATALAVGDLNGDGYLDAATANGTADSVSVLLGNGKGVLGHRMDYPTGNNPGDIAVRDWNRDKKLDIATVNLDDDSVSVLLGKGDGTFEAAVRSPVGQRPMAIAAGDFNHDGIEDIAAVNNKASTVSVLLGAGNGTFAPKVDYVTGKYPYDIVAGDLNQDGEIDLAALDGGANTVTVLIGAGNGMFNHPASPPATFSGNASDLGLGDLNGDGKADLIVSAQSGRYSSGALGVLFGVGDGSFLPPVDWSPDNSPAVAAADLNADGRSELVVSYNASLRVRQIADDGSLAAEAEYPTPAPPKQVTVGDFNGDRWLDIATIDSWGIYVLLATGNGKFEYPENQPVGVDLGNVLLRDLNGDNLLDLAASNPEADTANVLLGLGNGTFASGKQYPTGYGQGLITAGDLNNDGSPDLVTAGVSENGISVLWNAGDATFLTGADYPTATATDFLAIADLDNDGKQDIVAASVGYSRESAVTATTVLRNNGDGTFATRHYYDPEPWGKLALADLNHDGRSDLLGSDGEQDGLIVRLGLGDGTFGPALKSKTGQGRIAIYGAALGDLNADGELDLVAPDVGSTHLNVMLGVGNGTFVATVQYTTGNAGRGGVALGDLNGDDILDLLWDDFLAYVAPEMVVALGAGDGTFSCSTASLAGAPYSGSIALGDLNGDKRMDLVFPGSASQSVLVLLNQPL